MKQPQTKEDCPNQEVPMSSNMLHKLWSPRRAILLIVFWLLFAIVVVKFDRPPSSAPVETSLSLFSADRALTYLAHISRSPHPVGSPEHDQVRDYIVNTLQEMGVTAEVQKTSIAAPGRSLTTVENILGRLRGSGDGKAVLVVAHYDSVAAGPGAADDGAAVAAMLESVRVLKSISRLRRDVIVLFSDGEEQGLLGARAFVAGHPWVHDIAFVLNFEARGNRGPSMMFETSSGNGWLISHFGQAASHPVANSLSYEIYKRLPNDTDFTIFQRAGFSGLNFAFIDGLAYYHSPNDTIQNLDKGSLQHQGDYMVEMATQLGNAAAADPRSGNLIYFDLFGKVLVRYGSGAAILFLVAAIMLVLASFHLALRREAAKPGDTLIGAVSVLLGVVFVAVTACLTAWGLGAIHISSMLAGKNHDPALYIAVCTLVGIICGAAFFMAVIRRIGPESFSLGSLLVWSVVAILANIYLIGASYLIVWPLLFSAMGWLLVLVNRRIAESARTIILALSGSAVIAIIFPLAHKVFFAFSGRSSPMVSTLAGLGVSLLIGPVAYGLSRNQPASGHRDSARVHSSQLDERSSEKPAIAI
jgi:peptidase M28-like protein